MTVVLDTTIRPELLRGRGALSNAVGRYEKQTRVLLDDGWDDGWRADDDSPPPIRTEVIHDSTRTIIARNKSPDISFEQSINPYRGCEHGCIYCFARPTHAYLGMSPGVDFESRLFAKPNAAELLAKELSAPGYVPKVIAMGTNTDPYQPLEKKMRITRSILEVLRDDYVRTARAKGLQEYVIVLKHALRNALLPVVTIIGLELLTLFGGLVVIETVFTIPGIGRYLVDAITHRDYPSVQALVFVISLFVVTVNLLVDIVYGFLDPRIRYG